MNMEEKTWQKKSFLAGACRTAIGTMGGSLSTTPAAELGAIVIKEALNRAGVAPEAVDQVYMGCVIQAGLGQNVARQASIKAGLPIEVPAVTMNVVLWFRSELCEPGCTDDSRRRCGYRYCRRYGKYVYGSICTEKTHVMDTEWVMHR